MQAEASGPSAATCTRGHCRREGAVRANVTVEPLAGIDEVFGRMERGQIEGRIVLRP